MRPTRILSLAAIAAFAIIGVSCAETSPTAPTAATTAAPQGELLDLLGLDQTVRSVGLLTCSPMPAASASAMIGPLGGSIRVGPHRLDVPAGALDRRILITAYAPSARVNRVEFGPHGLDFARPATLTMSYANCDLLGSLLPKRIAYIDSNLNILELLRSLDDAANRRVSARLEHFSEYAVSW
jgi:ethanolamine utilization microcompartment shell protein EutS